MPKRPGEYLHVRDGDLAHLDRNGQAHPNEYPEHERLRFYLGLLHLANERGNGPGVAAPPLSGPLRTLAAAHLEFLRRGAADARGHRMGSSLQDQIRKSRQKARAGT